MSNEIVPHSTVGRGEVIPSMPQEDLKTTALDRPRTAEYDPHVENATALWNGEIAQRVQTIIDAVREFTGSRTSPIEQAREFFKVHRQLAPQYFDDRTLDENQYDRLLTAAFIKIIDKKLQRYIESSRISTMTGGGWNVVFQLGLLASSGNHKVELSCGGPQNLNHFGKDDTDRNFELRVGGYYDSNRLFVYDDEQSEGMREGYGVIKTTKTEVVGSSSIQTEIEVFPRPFEDLRGQKSKEYALQRKVRLNNDLLTTCSYDHLSPEGQVVLAEVYVVDNDGSPPDGFKRWFGKVTRSTSSSAHIEWSSTASQSKAESSGGWAWIKRTKLGKAMFGEEKDSQKGEKGPSTINVTLEGGTVTFSLKEGGKITEVPVVTNVLDAIPSFQNIAGQLDSAHRPQLPGA